MENKKVFFLTDMEVGLEAILQQETNIQPENMIILQSYDAAISHPYGDIMRSIIIAIHQEKVGEIIVVGTKNKRQRTIKNPFASEEQLKTLDYLFKTCKPEFYGDSLSEWLEVGGDVAGRINKSVEIIRNHPLVPSHVKIRSLVVNKEGEPAVVNR